MDANSQGVAGLYRHYKGQNYRVLGLVRHSESLEELVLYEALYENDLGRLWVRPKAMFFSDVIVGGCAVARFSRVED